MSDESRERIRVEAGALADTVKRLIHEGNVRRIIVKNDEGATIMEFPLTVGIIGLVAAPMVAAVGAVAVLASQWTIEVEREGDEPASPGQEGTSAGA